MKKYHILIILITWLIVHIGLFLHYGFRQLYDVQGYIDTADGLLHGVWVQQTYLYSYLTFLSFVALGRLLWSESVIHLIIVQSIISGIATLYLYKIASRLYKNASIGLLAAFIYLLWLDCIHWNIVLYTESLFASLLIFIISIVVNYKSVRKQNLSLLGLSLLIVFCRPTGFVVLIALGVFLIYYHRNKLFSLGKKSQLTLVVVTLFLGVIGASLLLEIWDFSQNLTKGNIITYMDTIKGGNLYYKDLHDPISPLHAYSNDDLAIVRMLKLIAQYPWRFLEHLWLKIFYLLSFYRPYYSLGHNLYNAIWLLLIYSGFAYGMIRFKNIGVKLFVITVVVVNCLLVGVAAVDWDNRFYIPMEPGIVLISSFGLYLMGSKVWVGLSSKRI